MIKLHSIETLGALDGPGLRTIFFLQGCPLRCLYCHNPDTWSASKGTVVTEEAIVEKALAYKTYTQPKGGVTFSGGEPLLQAKALIPLFRNLKEHGFHIALDTSGYGTPSPEILEELLSLTDLVLLDIKHEDQKEWEKITGKKMDRYWMFKELLLASQAKIWIKHVVVPGLTDQGAHLRALEREVLTFPHERVEKFELLPYHSLGKLKYDQLGLEYPLADTPDMDWEKLCELKKNLTIDCLI